MDFQEDIRKQQLLDKINVIRTITTETKESAVEPISKSLFDEFEGVDVAAIEKSLNLVGSLLGDEEVYDIEKAIGHKYFKREGTKGNYKYYYTEADYKAGKSEASEEDHKGLMGFKVGDTVTLPGVGTGKLIVNDFQKNGKYSIQLRAEKYLLKDSDFEKLQEGKDSDKKEEKSEEEFKMGSELKIKDKDYTVSHVEPLAGIMLVYPSGKNHTSSSEKMIDIVTKKNVSSSEITKRRFDGCIKSGSYKLISDLPEEYQKLFKEKSPNIDLKDAAFGKNRNGALHITYKNYDMSLSFPDDVEKELQKKYNFSSYKEER